MSIEIGSKWVKDVEVVEVVNLKDNFPYDLGSSYEECVWFCDNDKNMHVLTKRDFLEQYKPYEPVYEYRYCHISKKDTNFIFITENYFINDDEFLNTIECYSFQRLDFTNRERK